MVNFFIDKIINSEGTFTIDDVPTLWRSKVAKKLEEMQATANN